ncbi:hypothetical protein C8R41DRAFT_449081 [Lentinula lateritia]|uniref:Uncharacterized protein n=1 Tax=Lentinula lateritia TaxID=40482 RepID=A0ABQ8VCB0_9AGAR|nr:hypothetical protein C8R41DRAFT_449081 [Lentinula lateritia]
MVFSCSIITALIAAGAASSALAVPINARDLDDRRFHNVGEPQWQSSHRHHEDQFGGSRHRHHELLGGDEFEFEEHHPHSHHQGDDEFEVKIEDNYVEGGLGVEHHHHHPHNSHSYVHHHQAEVVSVSLEQKVEFSLKFGPYSTNAIKNRSSTIPWACRTRLGLTRPHC